MSVAFRRFKEGFARLRRPAVPEALRLPGQVLTRARLTGTLTFLMGGLVAFLWVNTTRSPSYLALRDAPLAVEWSGARASTTLRAAVNDGLMTLYFFSLTLGVRRRVEDWTEEGRSRAVVPTLAALGTLLLPALLIRVAARGLTFRAGLALGGFDVGLALAVFEVARRNPGSRQALLIFATAIEAGWMMSLFFLRGIISWPALAVCGAVGAAAFALRAIGARGPAWLAAVAVALWVAWNRTGLFPPLVGVLIAALVPGDSDGDERRVTEFAEAVIDDYDRAMDDADGDRCTALADRLAGVAAAAQSPLERWQRIALSGLTWVVLPLFGWVNGGLPVSGATLRIFPLALVALWWVGRPVGAVAFGALAGLGSRPDGVTESPSMLTVVAVADAGGISVAVGALAALPGGAADRLVFSLIAASLAGMVTGGLLLSLARRVAADR